MLYLLVGAGESQHAGVGTNAERKYLPPLIHNRSEARVKAYNKLDICNAIYTSSKYGTR